MVEQKRPNPEIGSAEILRLYIRDDQGYAWTFDNGRIVSVRDLVDGVKMGGYECGSFLVGIAMLNKMGIITGNTEVLDPTDKPMPEPFDEPPNSSF